MGQIIHLETEEVSAKAAVTPLRTFFNFVWSYVEDEDLYYCDLMIQEGDRKLSVSVLGDRAAEEIEVVIMEGATALLAYTLPTTNFQKGTYLLAVKHALILL